MISKDYNKVDQEVEVRLTNLEIQAATTQRDVAYIKETIDNHVISAIKELDRKLDVMGPKVEDSHRWINRMQRYVVWPAAGSAIVAVVLAALRYWLGVI